MSEQKKAPYSVLMSVYEKETAENLRQSVESIFAQTVLPSEFVLVVDGKIGTELQNEVSALSQKYLIKLVAANRCSKIKVGCLSLPFIQP